ncbi:MAG: alpha/beta fold hydrolase, partial [Synechococcus sp. ELA619]
LLAITDGLAIASAPAGLGRSRSPTPTPPTSRPSGHSQLISLPVAHRSTPLQLVLWPSQGSPPSPGWVLLMPGLGGSAAQLGWLGAALAERGWPVLVLEHPGSDEQAVRALLNGLKPPPGAETLPIRLQDVQAVVAAEQAGRLPRLGRSVVLMGHSFGGLTALLAAGLRPEADLASRCRRAMRQLPLTNLSRLLQCQLARVTLPTPQPLAQPVAGLVIFNGFGSLLWPNRGLAGLDAPVLLVGGSLDLVTPPLGEQLELFLPEANPRNRLALVYGASHFSPVRIRPGAQALFQLGDDLVGLAPERVQGMELSLTSEFLLGLEAPMVLPPQRRKLGGVNAYVLDRAAAARWRAALKT